MTIRFIKIVLRKQNKKQKLKTSCSSNLTILFTFHQHVVQILFKEMYEETSDFQCQPEQL